MRTNTITLLTLGALTLSACQQQGAGYEDNQNTYKGAGMGALIGAGLGAMVNDDNRGKGAAIGAGIGALAGGGIGQYTDRQERAMRQATSGTGIDVKRQGNDLLLNMPSSVTFKVDSGDIDPSFYAPLNNVASVLRDFPNTMLEITGHTDSTGEASYNYTLSKQRAQSVTNYLTNKGVTQRIITSGEGETQPIATNTTSQGRAQNRRVEMKITPIVN